MAYWGPFSQPGNTTYGWTLSGGNITNHEAFAVELDNATPSTTGAMIDNIIVYVNPTRYGVQVVAEGAGAISYHINSNQV
jgi:hypothetical protein